MRKIARFMLTPLVPDARYMRGTPIQSRVWACPKSKMPTCEYRADSKNVRHTYYTGSRVNNRVVTVWLVIE